MAYAEADSFAKVPPHPESNAIFRHSSGLARRNTAAMNTEQLAASRPGAVRTARAAARHLSAADTRTRHASESARLVKLADKICNLRDIAARPPASWSRERRQEYFEWAKEVVDRLRGTHPGLERKFDEAYALKP